MELLPAPRMVSQPWRTAEFAMGRLQDRPPGYDPAVCVDLSVYPRFYGRVGLEWG